MLEPSFFDRRTFLQHVLTAGAAVAGLDTALRAAGVPESSAHGARRCNPFFAFDNGTGRGVLPPEQQAKMLKELGYDGIGYTGTQAIPQMLEALDRHELKMFSTYVRADVGKEKASYDPGLPAAVKQLKGRGTAIWLHIVGKGARAQRQTVELVREVAAMAAQNELPVITYPHTGMFVETIEDSVRIAKQVNMPNVGASFNLCHWLKVDGDQLETRLRKAVPYLRLVSINGADAGNTRQMGWDRLIQPLGVGSYDVAAVVRLLNQLGYRHPVGLQCYNVPGDRRANLQTSIATWHRICAAGIQRAP